MRSGKTPLMLAILGIICFYGLLAFYHFST
jgi:hypothetical protein